MVGAIDHGAPAGHVARSSGGQAFRATGGTLLDPFSEIAERDDPEHHLPGIAPGVRPCRTWVTVHLRTLSAKSAST